MNEKEFAEIIKDEFLSGYIGNENYCCKGYPEASIPVKNMNFDLLKNELNKYDLKVSKGCDLKHISRFYLNQWNKFKTIFVYADECNL